MRKLISAGAFVLALAGCASGVVPDTSVGVATQTVNPHVESVSLTPSAAAQEMLADNNNFSMDDLSTVLQKTLKERDLVQPGSGQRMEVEVTDLRARSGFSAVMFGVFAGNDHVAGTVRLRDASGKVIKKFDVNASYALGGIAGGVTSTRMNWLYEAFAKQCADTLAGPSDTGTTK